MSTDTKTMKQEILDVLQYRRDDYFVGGIATCGVCRLLGTPYPSSDIKGALEKASYIKLCQVQEYLIDYIVYMKQHPMKKCPTCGTMVDA